MCIKPNEEDFTTIYHELGHAYYYLAYNKLPPLFQAGANDGFHEAIGDTIVLAMTPEYLHSIGLVGEQQQGHDALINSKMRMALAKVAVLPFGLLIDRWRWRSEEHTSELQSLMRISYAVFCLKKKQK